jgi:hypothetical protein
MRSNGKVKNVEQIAFKFDSDEIELFKKSGAMYAYAPGKPFEEIPIELGDKIISPGQFIKRLGEKKRSSFEMSDGYFLRYVGKSGDYILFGVNDFEEDYYYAFGYISKNVLVVAGGGTGYDIRLQTLDVLSNC